MNGKKKLGLMARMFLGKRASDMLTKFTDQDILERLDRVDGLLLGGRTNSGAVVTHESAMRQAAVYTAVRILADSIALLPCKLKTKDPTKENTFKDAEDHPLYNVLYRQPNKWMTAFEFWRFVMVSVLLRGNFYGLVTRNGLNQVAEIVPLDGDRITVKLSDSFDITYHYQPAQGEVIILKQGDVFHVRAMGTGHLVGKSIIQQARESIGIASQMEVHAAKVFENGAKVGLILTHPEIVSDEVADRIKASFEKAYSGAENAHKTVLLEEGIKVEKISMSFVDSQFIEQRKYQRAEIFGMFGIPPHMAGDTEKTTSWGSGIESQQIGFNTYVMLPHETNIEQAIYRDLLTKKERKTYYAKFSSDAIIRGDMLTRYKAYEIGLKNRFLVPNECRAREDMNPVDWGNEPLKDAPKPDAPKDPADDTDSKPETE